MFFQQNIFVKTITSSISLNRNRPSLSSFFDSQKYLPENL